MRAGRAYLKFNDDHSVLKQFRQKEVCFWVTNCHIMEY